MKNCKLQDSDNGHIVMVIEKTRILERLEYPTYGKAMWGIKRLEEKYQDDPVEIEYRDVRTFREDDYGEH